MTKAICAIFITVLLGVVAFSLSAGATTGPEEGTRTPAANMYINCNTGVAYIGIENPDMQGQILRIEIDGVVTEHAMDNASFQYFTDALAIGVPHRMTLYYDFVVNGNEDEINQQETVSCLDVATTSTTVATSTSTTGASTTTTVAPTTTTVPPATTSTTGLPCTPYYGYEYECAEGYGNPPPTAPVTTTPTTTAPVACAPAEPN